MIKSNNGINNKTNEITQALEAIYAENRVMRILPDKSS